MPLQIIKRRIKSVTATRQMTKAMQLVASSKLRQAQAALAAPNAYLAAATSIVEGLEGDSQARRHRFYQPPDGHGSLTVVIGGDRGLAGAYNSNLYRQLSQAVDGRADDHLVISVGRRASTHLARFANLKLIGAYNMDDDGPVTALAAPIVSHILSLYDEAAISQVNLVTTKFTSAIKQTTSITQLLPRTPDNTDSDQTDAVLEPGLVPLLEAAVTRLIEAEVASAIAHARTSEQAARMMAMMTATDNATDLVDDLTLELNTVRQAHITQEIAEITTGAAALT